MNHRIVSGVISLLLLLFVTAALVFAVSVRPLWLSEVPISTRPAQIPHEQGGAYASCRSCHRKGGGAVAPPATHRQLQSRTCTSCHPSTRQGT